LHDERELHARMAELEDCLAELSVDGPPNPDDPVTNEVIRDQMEQLGAVPGGAAALVDRYAGDDRVAVIRPLAFMLAGVANEEGAAHALAGTVFAMLERLRVDDPWPRLNLCTAVQRLLMFGAVTALDEPAQAALVRLLRESLASVPLVRATAATVISDLHRGRRQSLLPAAEIGALRDKLLALVDDPDKLTRKEARGYASSWRRPEVRRGNARVDIDIHTGPPLRDDRELQARMAELEDCLAELERRPRARPDQRVRERSLSLRVGQ